MARNSEEYSYTSYPENYYDNNYPDMTQSQHQQHPHQHQHHQQQQNPVYNYQPSPSAYHAQTQQQHAAPMYYGHSHHNYNQPGPSYHAGSSQLYQIPVEEAEYHEESPSPYDEHGHGHSSFGQFQIDQGYSGDNSNIEHIITEHELPAVEMTAYFPPANKTEIHTDKGVIWRCRVCAKEIPARNKIEHIFKHKDQPRYTCTCKAKFARGQDKNRHLKEQALCSKCGISKVGRRGQNGKCQQCL
ncbi:hypothetical protein Clacol_008872 [Clathrus columnatus]|uniref:Uncharacterized protein n=1 Tax=Clathrus columnatus TaxID=1419009 RepID=A0AAV5ANY3_9AGAM|nr:hypothetical protein Clacol_008872 [Clathrus columnatus]